MHKASNSYASVKAPGPVIKGRRSSKIPAKGAKGKRNDDSDIVESCGSMIAKANQSLMHVMQGDADGSEQPSIPDSLLAVPSEYDSESSCDGGKTPNKNVMKGRRSPKTPKGAKCKRNSDSDMLRPMISNANKSSEQSSMPDSLLEVPSGYDSESSCDGDVQVLDKRTVKDVDEYLKGKVGADINAKKWLEGCAGLDDFEKSEVILRLVYEICLAKNIEYDLRNDAAENEKENNKDRNFDTRRIFEILKKVNRLLLPPDRRRLVELVCQSGNVKLLEMICQQESIDGGDKTGVDRQYSWKGEFTGYERLIDLLQYVLKQPCSSEIVLCIAKKVYGNAHILCNGERYLDDTQVSRIKANIDYPDSVIKNCLKAAIKLGYANVVSVMLSGDIYHGIRLMKDETFKKEKRFREAFDFIEETVAEVLNSWVTGQNCKSEVLGLIKDGIEIDVGKMKIKDLMDELRSQGIEFSDKDKRRKEILVEKLGKGKVRLRKTVVGALISALFFNYQDELMVRPFRLKISHQDKCLIENQSNELNQKSDSKKFVQEMVLKSIQALNSSTHVKNNWFFRQVLSAIVNDNLEKLKAVCTAICKEEVEESVGGTEVHKDVIGALGFFGVEISPNQITTSEVPISLASIGEQFAGNMEHLVKGIRELKNTFLMEDEVLEIAEGLVSGKVPAFSGLSRRTIVKLKNKREEEALTDNENKDLKEKVLKIMSEIKKGIDILAKSVNNEYRIDIEDIFRHFKVINCEIERENKREIVELIGQSGNVRLLEMICRQENKDGGGKARVDRQYSWKGEFTGYERLIDLLQYVLKELCSSEIVLCIAKKVFGYAHILYNGRQYLDDVQIARMKANFDYAESDIENCLKAAIVLGYADVVSVMLSGDVYHCIRLMKDEKFEEDERFREAFDMTEEAVAEVMDSWVTGQSCKNEVIGLLKEGIEIDVEKMTLEDLVDELGSQGIELSEKDKRSKRKLVEKLGGKGKIRLKKTVVGASISTLFFNNKDQLMEKSFQQRISPQDQSVREKTINELSKKMDSKKFLQESVLKSIKEVNSSSHVKNNWFFREVLEKVVKN